MTDPLLPTTERPPAPRALGAAGRTSGRLLVAIAALAAGDGAGRSSASARCSGRLGGSNAPDFKGNGTDPVVVEVPAGRHVRRQIGRVLAAAGVVKSSARLRCPPPSKDDAKARSLQPGFYRLRKQMSGKAAFDLLLDPSSRAESKFTLPEGLTVRQALPIISKGTGIPVAELEKATTQTGAARPAVLRQGRRGLPVPGHLHRPAGREAGRGAADDGRPVQPGGRPAEPGRRAPRRSASRRCSWSRSPRSSSARCATTGARPPACSTTGSADTKDFPTLGLDSTVRYALNDFPGALTQSQLDIDSPYNTRKHPGIPPGPIGNPGTVALQAALNPTPGQLGLLPQPAEGGQDLLRDDHRRVRRPAQEARGQQGGSGGY